MSTIERLTENCVSVTFTGDSLSDFKSLSFDDHVKFIFSNTNGETVRRDYTPRKFDLEKRELVIEFALHEFGDASEWARNAKPGDEVVIAGPKGSMIIPSDFDWHLFIADSTALPAVSRRLEELAVDEKVIIIGVENDRRDHRKFANTKNTVTRWVDNLETLSELVNEMVLPDGIGFVWIAGEHSLVLKTKQQISEKGHPSDLIRASAYWKKDESGFSLKI